MRLTFLLLILLLLTACGDPNAAPAATASTTPPPSTAAPGAELQAVIASAEVVVGPNRLAVGLLKDGKPLEEATVRERFFFLDAPDQAEQARVRSEHDAVYYGEGLELGVFVSHPSFDQPGTWGMLGAQAPASHNRTVATEPDLSKLTSDDQPDPELYQLTIADAIASGRPTVVLFATPRFCTSRTCGPTLELLKGLKRDYSDRANFIHVEIYQDFATLQPVPEVEEWGLPSEPWLFILDGAGRVLAKFEGGLTRPEIEPALTEVLLP
jgi:hypothetical protein